MSEQPEKVEHPSWCDPHACTSPEFRPTSAEKGQAFGEHRSRTVTVPGYDDPRSLKISLSESVAPWGTGTFLRIATADMQWSTQIGEGGAGFELFELLALPVGDLTRAFPTLYGKRFGYVAEATDPNGLDEWDTLPGVTDTYPSTSLADNAEHVEEYDDDERTEAAKFVDRDFEERGPQYQLTVNDAAAARGTFREVRTKVAELVTGWLADDPEGLALEAQTINLAFNTGSVSTALEERGEWSTTVGVHSEHATMRIRVTREV